MRDALDLLKRRKSIPSAFLGEPAPDEGQLAEMLTIASRVPDHGKLAPWRFIVFRGDAGKRASGLLADLRARKEPGLDERILTADRNRLAQAPMVVAVVSTAAPHVKIPEFEQVLSAGNAAMKLLLAAEAMGFAGHWTTGWIAYDEDAGRILGLRPGERFVGFIHLGTPTAPPTERPRPALGDIVTDWSPPHETV